MKDKLIKLFEKICDGSICDAEDCFIYNDCINALEHKIPDSKEHYESIVDEFFKSGVENE